MIDDLVEVLLGTLVAPSPRPWDTKIFVVSMILIVVVTVLCLVFRS
jgi:hypothetical protein